MGIEFSLDLGALDHELQNVLKEFRAVDVVQAARRAINRTLLGVRQKSLDDIRSRLNVKERDLRKRMRVHKAQGNSLATLEGSVSYSTDSFPLLSFVKGSKAPIKQKGIPVARRRRLKVEIEKGKVFTVKGAFIQRKHSVQVFRKLKKAGFKKQGIRSLGFMITNRGLGESLQDYGQRRFVKEFFRELDVRASKIVTSADQVTAGGSRPKRGRGRPQGS